MTNKEKTLELNKKLLYIGGGMLVVCGLISLAIVNEAADSMFPTGSEDLPIFLITYGALVLGLFFIYRGFKCASEAEELRAQPIRTAKACVRTIDTSRMTVDGTARIVFKLESGDLVCLYQEESFTYIEGDVGELRYKGDRIIGFAYKS